MTVGELWDKLAHYSDDVEIIGYPGVRDNKGSYSSLWEIIRSSSGCIGYFGDCENYEKIHPEWDDWKSRPIDPKIYP